MRKFSLSLANISKIYLMLFRTECKNLRRIKKPVFFVVIGFILIFTCLTFIGISTQYGDIKTVFIKGIGDTRWGIDIRGGVDVTFTPPEGVDATEAEMDSAKAVIEQRLVSLNITDNEVYVDYNKNRIIVRFPWKSGDETFDPEAAVKEIGETALLTFRKGQDENDLGEPIGEIVLYGKDVESAYVSLNDSNHYVVALNLTAEGGDVFAEVTGELAGTGEVISIWMDEALITAATVNETITGGKATISNSSGFDLDYAKSLANKINAGALPFKLETASFSTISPTLGLGARDAMALAGIIAFAAIAIFMVCVYKLPGFVAVFSLIGHIAGTFAAVTGFFGFMDSFTLTIPGIAGIILGIGMGVDANVISFERIKEEIRTGKTIDGAIELGYQRGFTAIFDGNITVIIVSIILMGAFGPPDSFFAKMLNPVLFMFGPSTAGTVYSFGYTLLVGVIMNFLMSVLCSRLMLSSISKFKVFRKASLYGGEKNARV